MKYSLLCLLFSSCALIRQYPDSPIEEAVEEWIDEETGIKIDFTGDSKEVACVSLAEISF